MLSKTTARRIALFSDIHANLPALNAVLDDIQSQGITECYCLGDFVDFAPWPNDVIARIRHAAIPAVYGNHDRRVCCNEAVTTLPWHSQAEAHARETAIALSKAAVSDDNQQWLRNLPFSRRLALGDCRVLLVHASPRSVSEYLTEDFPAETLLHMQQQYDFDVLIAGHTHRAYVRQLATHTARPVIVANTGAVGRIKPGEPHATWLELVFQSGLPTCLVHSVTYNIQSVVQAIAASDIPDFYADELRHHGVF